MIHFSKMLFIFSKSSTVMVKPNSLRAEKHTLPHKRREVPRSTRLAGIAGVWFRWDESVMFVLGISSYQTQSACGSHMLSCVDVHWVPCLGTCL